MQSYRVGCKSCEISQGVGAVLRRGGIVELSGNWVLNHYGGDEGFLGWLALSPRFHRRDIADLEADEAMAMGKNIQRVDLALRQYWSITFPNDLVQRVYIAHFHESVFGDTKSTLPSDDWHSHIHLIPRTVRLGGILRRFGLKRNNTDESIRAWSMPEIFCEGDFPPEYKKTTQNMSALMTYLRGQLQSHD